MGVSKFVYRGDTKFDISNDTVTAEHLEQGYTAHGADGEPIVGSLTTGGTLINKTITENGIYDPADDDADGYDEVTVAIPTGTAGTPTATKGSVSNHSVSITPSVINTGGVIPGGTINGTPVTVSASELASGSETKTENGIYDVTNLAELVVNVAQGALNVVTGTFKGTTTGAAMDITLDYSGNGYPVVCVIYPKEGTYNANGGTFYNLVKRYAAVFWMSIKNDTTAPTYQSTGAQNQAIVYGRYKNSASDATSQTGASTLSVQVYSGASATSGNTSNVRFKSKTTMSVFIAASSYGFAANIEYEYLVLYSS